MMTDQSITFLCSVLLGFCIGAVYDVFRITRIAVKTHNVLIFIEDVIFFVVATVVSFIFIVIKNDGILRGFLLIGELLGAILYFFTLSILVIKAAKVIIAFIKSVLKFLYKVLIHPFVLLVSFIYNLIRPLYPKIALFIKMREEKRVKRKVAKPKELRVMKKGRNKKNHNMIK